MDKISVIGLDLAKNVFQVHTANAQGRKLSGKKLKRSEVLDYFSSIPPCLVGMEACGGAHEWARRKLCRRLGRQISAKARPEYRSLRASSQECQTNLGNAAKRRSIPCRSRAAD